MKKVYKKLLKEQKKRGIIFSSTLSKYKTECLLDNVHEVNKKNDDKEKTIERLKNDSFFDKSPIFKYNIIRT